MQQTQFVSKKSDPIKWSCSICCKGVGNNSIFCQTCNRRVHKRCSKIKGKLKADPSFKCDACANNIYDNFPSWSRSDSIGHSGSCFESATDRVRAAWKNFHSLLPLLTNSGISLKVRGHAYNTCICSVLLYASETWTVKVDDIHQLVRNDNAMIRWICSAKLCEKIPMSDLRTHVGISSIKDVIRYNCLRWFGHLQCMGEEKWPRKILKFEVTGSYPWGKPRKKWFDNIRSGKLGLSTSLAQDHSKWRNAIKLSRHVAESNPHCWEKKDNKLDSKKISNKRIFCPSVRTHLYICIYICIFVYLCRGYTPEKCLNFN